MHRSLLVILLAGCGLELSEQDRNTLEQLRLVEANRTPAMESADRPAPDSALVQLGQDLFFDCDLTSPISDTDSPLGPVGAMGVLSCASCHQPRMAAANARQDSPGVAKVANKHTPSVFNASWRQRYGWKAEHETLLGQVTVPLFGLHGVVETELPDQIRDRHLAAWQAAFGPTTIDDDAALFPGVAEALAAFLASERMDTPDSVFDAYLAGKDELDAFELAGARLFIGKAGCVACHSGPLLADGKLHDLGVPGDHALRNGLRATAEDPEAWDKAGKYQTPTLRNVGRSAPYMHDGSMVDLWEVLDFYNRGGGSSEHLDPRMVPLGLTEAELTDLEAFLHTLTGDPPEPLPEVLCPLP